jgi:hypothetical protein
MRKYLPSEVINDERLSGILGCPLTVLPILEEKLSDNGCFVRQKKILKRNKKLGFREVYHLELFENPIKELKSYLNECYQPLSCVHGFVHDRSIVTNARLHLCKKMILNVDLENFFESISTETVAKSFEQLGFVSSIALRLAKIATYEDRLVAGFPTSPTIANMVCIEMDTALVDFCSLHNLTYTRYADDLSFSGDNVDVLEEIETIVAQHGFALNQRKTRFYRKGQSQYVTGLTVADSSYPRIPRRFKDKLRQKLYYMDKYGVFSYVERKYNVLDAKYTLDFCHREMNNVKGWIDYINSIEPKLASQYYLQYNKIKKTYESALVEWMESILTKNKDVVQIEA